MYSIQEVAKMSGVSSRTLRYYDEIELLPPADVSESGYRLYSSEQLDTLQEILIYREQGFPLKQIAKLIHAVDRDKVSAYKEHLSQLKAARMRLDAQITTVEKSLEALQGVRTMTAQEKFEGFKQQLINENEKTYGEEIREKYSDTVVDASNQKLKDMDPKTWQQAQVLSAEINKLLKEGLASGDIQGELAIKLVETHKTWLCLFWPDGLFSPEAHCGLAHMYLEDARFKKYYDAVVPGAAKFLHDAIYTYWLNK